MGDPGAPDTDDPMVFFTAALRREYEGRRDDDPQSVERRIELMRTLASGTAAEGSQISAHLVHALSD